MKNLATLREKKRYVVFRVHSRGEVPYQSLKHAILETLLEFLGENEFGRARIRLVKNLWNGKEGFLQTTPKFVDSVKMGMALIHQIGEERVAFQTLKVTGTILSGKKAL